MKILITGVTGFVGSYLAEYALEKNVEIFGQKRWRSPMENIQSISNKINLVDCDLTDLSSTLTMIK